MVLICPLLCPSAGIISTIDLPVCNQYSTIFLPMSFAHILLRTARFIIISSKQ